MRQILFAIVVFYLFIFSSQMILAQDRIGMQGSVVVPMGDLDVIASTGGGGGIFYDRMLGSKWGVSADVGWYQFGSHNASLSYPWLPYVKGRFQTIPIQVGVKYHDCLHPLNVHYYIGAMLGPYVRSLTPDSPKGPNGQPAVTFPSQRKTVFGFALQLGFFVPVASKLSLMLGLAGDVISGENNPQIVVSSTASLVYMRIELGISYSFGGNSKEANAGTKRF